MKGYSESVLYYLNFTVHTLYFLLHICQFLISTSHFWLLQWNHVPGVKFPTSTLTSTWKNNSKDCCHTLYFNVYYKSHFTSFIFVNSPWGILWKGKRNTQSFIFTYMFTSLALVFPSGRSVFLFSVIILLHEKYPLPFLVVQVFGQPNFSLFICLKRYYFTLVFKDILTVWNSGWTKRGFVFLSFFLPFKIPLHFSSGFHHFWWGVSRNLYYCLPVYGTSFFLRMLSYYL